MNRFQTTIFLLVSIAILYMAKEVLVPLALAGVISMLLAGPVKRLEKAKVPRAIAVTICVVIAFGMIGLFGYIVGSQVIGLAKELPRYRQEISDKYNTLMGSGAGNPIKEVKETIESA